MKKTWKPISAAVLMLLASLPYIFASIRWFINPGYIPEDQGGGPVWPWVGVIILFPFWSPLITGATCALFRRACGLAFVSAMTPLLLTIFLRPWGWEDVGVGYLLESSPVSIYILVTVVFNCLMGGAAILLWFSRKDFTDRQISSQRLYSPPDKIREMLSR